jgi:hypothetical protein
MKRKKREGGKRKGKEKKSRKEEALDAYVDSNNQLRDQAIDRFCSATCKIAELEVGGSKGRIVWISSLAFEAALTACKQPGTTRVSVQRKLGFKDISVEECDVILGSVHSGAHWSSLVLFLDHPSGGRARAFHYDSIYGHNTTKAREIVEMLSRAGILLPDVRVDNPSDFPQQRDSYECGHVVLMTVNSVTAKYKRCSRGPTAPLIGLEYPDISEERIRRIRTNIVKRVLG